MLYSLTITIGAGLLLLLLLAATVFVVRRVAKRDYSRPSFGGWQWYPSPLGRVLLLLVPVAALVLWRVFPELLFLPILVPFFSWRRRSRAPAGQPEPDDDSLEGRYRPLDDQ